MLCALAVMVNGCAVVVVGGAAAGAGAIVWYHGEMRSTDLVTFDRAYVAAQAGLKDLGYSIAEKTKGDAEAKITARAPGGKKVQVLLSKQSSNATNIGIRVGLVGDKELSRQILDKIRCHY